VDRLKRSTPGVPGIVSATRGNHGQWLAFAAARAGIPAVIHVPYGNSPDQNSAMRVYFDDTHQVAEGAGAAPLAALMREQGRHANRRVGVILSGGNIERARFEAVLRNITPGTPQPA